MVKAEKMLMTLGLAMVLMVTLMVGPLTMAGSTKMVAGILMMLIQEVLLRVVAAMAAPVAQPVHLN